MRKLILKMSMTVDGFVGGPDGQTDWMVPSRSAEGTAWILERLSQVGVHVMGRKTFVGWATFWPRSDNPLAKPMNEIPKVVFSTRANNDLAEAWAGSRVATGDLGDEIERMKREPGNDIFAHGGVGFARSLVERALVDEFLFVVHPVSIGKGLSLFDTLSKPLHLSLLNTTRFASGVVVNAYRPTGSSSSE